MYSYSDLTPFLTVERIVEPPGRKRFGLTREEFIESDFYKRNNCKRSHSHVVSEKCSAATDVIAAASVAERSDLSTLYFNCTVSDLDKNLIMGRKKRKPDILHQFNAKTLIEANKTNSVSCSTADVRINDAQIGVKDKIKVLRYNNGIEASEVACEKNGNISSYKNSLCSNDKNNLEIGLQSTLMTASPKPVQSIQTTLPKSNSFAHSLMCAQTNNVNYVSGSATCKPAVAVVASKQDSTAPSTACNDSFLPITNPKTMNLASSFATLWLNNAEVSSALQSFMSSSLWMPNSSNASIKGDQSACSDAKRNDHNDDNADDDSDGTPEEQSSEVTRESLAAVIPDKNTRLELKNTGQSYINTKGKIVEAKKVAPQDCSKCVLRCNSKFSEADRQSIFAEYWGLADYNKQREYLAEHMHREEKLGPSGLTRTVVLYYLTHKTKVQVCRQFFLKTLDVSEKASRIVLEKKVRGEFSNTNTHHSTNNRTCESSQHQ